MNKAEKLLVKHGAQKVNCTSHLVYNLAGVRFTLHLGSKPNPREWKSVRCKLRQLIRRGLVKEK